jgi:hypothetical protein
MSSGNVISAGNYGNIPSADRINTLNLDQSIRAVTVLKSPLIKFFIGSSLGFDEFNSLLEKDPTGYALNMEKLTGADTKSRFNYSFKDDSTLYIDEYVRLKTDVLPPPYLEVAAGAAIIGSATVTDLAVTENAAYHGLEGMRLLHVKSSEILLIPTDVDPASSDTLVPVLRGIDGTTATTTIAAGDRLLVLGQQPDLYGNNLVTPRRIRKRKEERRNGWGFQMTMGMPITTQLREEGLQYNGQFLQLVDADMIRNHSVAILNDILFTDRGVITPALATKDPVGYFNGFKHFAAQNPLYSSLQDIGALTPSKFLAATTWFNEFQDIASSGNDPILYFCGTGAFNAFQEYIKSGALIVAENYVPETMGSVVKRWITSTGKVIEFAIDPYLDLIGQTGTVFATAKDNVSMIVGKSKFFYPPNQRIQGFGDRAHFMHYISDFIADRNTKLDAIMSYYSLQVGYPELLMVMTGISSATV